MTSDVLPNRSSSGSPSGNSGPARREQSAGHPDPAEPGDDTDPIDDYLEHAVTAAPRRRRLPVITLVLLAGVVAAAAFTAGLITQDRRAEDQAAAAGPGGLPDFAAGGGFPGGGELPEGFSLPEGMELPGTATGDTPTAATGDTAAADDDPTIAGDVVLADSGSLYVDIGADAPVKVLISDTTSVVVTSDPSVTSVDAVETGAHVIVDGSRTQDNDLDATTIVVTS